MFDYKVDIYRKPAASSRIDSDTGQYSETATLIYGDVAIELQPKARTIERNGIKIEITTQMFSGAGIELEMGDIVVDGDNRYEVVSDFSIGQSGHWYLRRIE